MFGFLFFIMLAINVSILQYKAGILERCTTQPTIIA